MTDALDRLRTRPAATDTVLFAADPADADRWRTAQAKVAATTGTDHADALDELDELRSEIVTVAWTLEAVGATVVEDLAGEHPAPSGQQGWYDPKTFGPAVVALCLRRLEFSDDPDGARTGLTAEQVAQLFAGPMSAGDRDLLVGAAMALNQRGSGVGDLGKG